jgi:hypothetical protein
MIEENINEDFPSELTKPTRTSRWLRSQAARARRKLSKMAIEKHSFKEEKEARERLLSKRKMIKLQQRKKANALAS